MHSSHLDSILPFVRQPAKLTFTDESDSEELAGLVVYAKRFSMHTLDLIMTETFTNRADSRRAVAQRLAQHVVSWNLAGDDGEPIPMPSRDVAGAGMVDPSDSRFEQAVELIMRRADYAVLNEIGAKLLSVSLEVPAPLPRTSGAGSASVEVSMPMDVS